MSGPVWSKIVTLGELPATLSLEADEATRKRIAKELDLAALSLFTGEASVMPWMDGAELTADWRADVTLTCGLTLDPFEEVLSGRMIVRCVPQTSELAEPPSPEVELDPMAEDPPDVLEDDRIDVAAYLVEHLALALPAFPRKPGAVFEPPPPEEPPSPFAVLLQLKPKPPQGEEGS
jgi:hypothetical protein